jgi:hypothetical protein
MVQRIDKIVKNEPLRIGKWKATPLFPRVLNVFFRLVKIPASHRLPPQSSIRAQQSLPPLSAPSMDTNTNHERGASDEFENQRKVSPNSIASIPR